MIGPGAGGCCGNVSGSAGAAPVVSKKLVRDWARPEPRFTSSSVYCQPPPVARRTSDPVGLRPLVEAASCSTVKVKPAIVRAPERAAPGFEPTLNATVPGPEPFSPEVIERKSELD